MGKRLEHETWGDFMKRDPKGAEEVLDEVRELIKENKRLIEIEESELPPEFDPQVIFYVSQLIRPLNQIIRYLKKSAQIK